MIYTNNNGIIHIDECNMIREVFCNKVHKKHNTEISINLENNRQYSKYTSSFTNEEWDIINDNADKFFKEHWNAITNIAKKIVSKSKIKQAWKAFKFSQFNSNEILILKDNDYRSEFKNELLVVIDLAYIDVWNAEPNARIECGGPIVNGVHELAYEIESAINRYSRDNNIKIYGFVDGDWDTFNIFLYIPCKYLLSQSKNDNNSEESANESMTLYSLDADNFLEYMDIGINLENKIISIGKFIMDGYLGQSILAKNGIILNEDHIAINNKYILNEFRSHGHFNPERLEDRIDSVEGNKNKSSNNERLYKNPPSVDEINKRFKSIFNQSENNPSKKSGKKITLDNGAVVTLPENSIILNGDHIVLEGSTIFKYANLITK